MGKTHHRRQAKNDKVVYLSEMRLDQNCVQKSECGMSEVRGKCTDASGKAGLHSVYKNVRSGKTGLCGQLDVYTQEFNRLNTKKDYNKSAVESAGLFLYKPEQI